jgi:hypothetical protein
MNHGPLDAQTANRNIALEIVLTLITCGIYGLIWQYRQMTTLNQWLGREEYNFLLWLVLSLLTCGIYAIYNEYKMGQSIIEVQQVQGFPVSSDIAVMSVLFTLFGLGVVSLAIQQDAINRFSLA